MTPDCYRPGPLRRHGTTQEGRAQAALLPDSIQIDGRRMIDMICFASRYAGQLAFYNGRNEHVGDWTRLLRPDLSFMAAHIASRTWVPLAATFEKYVEELVDNLGAADRRNRYKTLFDVVFSLYLEIEEMHRGLPASPLATDVQREITGRLREALTLLVRYYRAAIGEAPSPLDLVNPAHWQPPAPDDGFVFRELRAVTEGSLSPIWIPDDAATGNWQAWSNSLAANTSIFQGTNDEKRTASSIPHVRTLWDRAYNAYMRIIRNAANRLEASLTDHPAHQPHVALLLAFFRLFGTAQSDLNALTKEHLDFYLRRVLELQTRPAQPDTVHVIVELAKHVRQHEIAAGTELKGGKDDDGVERIYMVDEDLVANHTRVHALRTLFVDDADPSGGVFDAPQAKSLSGLGEVELDPDSPLFRPFGQPQAGLTQTTMKRSTIGWAVASPLLRLAEGERHVTLDFIGEPGGAIESLSATGLDHWFEVAFSGAETWITADAATVTARLVTEDSSQPTLRIEARLGAESAAVVDYNDTVLDGAYDTPWPVARIRLHASDTDGSNRHAQLRDIEISQVTVGVEVDGVTDLVLQNDFGPLDPSGALLPFGPRPKLGSNFYVGSYEAMTKPLESLELELEWLGLPSTSFATHYEAYKDDLPQEISENSDFKADISFLKGGEWGVKIDTPRSLFDLDEDLDYFIQTYPYLRLTKFSIESNSTSATGSGSEAGGSGREVIGTGGGGTAPKSWLTRLSFGSGAPARFAHMSFDLAGKLDNEPDLPNFDTFDLNIQQGFLRLELAAPLGAFGHDVYPKLYADRVIKRSRPETDNNEAYTLPNEPYTPTLRSLRLNYEASDTLDNRETTGRDSGQFYQIHPFGLREITTNASHLLAPYLHDVDGALQPYEGALFIGLERAEPGSVISLMVQIAEGTEDSSLEPPDAIVWSYLSGDRWLPLGDAVVGDTTRGFLAAGIVRIQIPDDADTDNRLLAGSAPRGEREAQPALRWVRASISNNYAALPQMLDVRAQALRATFDDRGNAASHLETPLPAGEVTKLVEPQSAIKKIDQPYESFGGRQKEAPRRFYVRTSERLRHKQRAITMWDYERLVLEEFPSLYKVKCVQHARRDPTSKATEVIPGSVVVVVIPDFRDRSAGDKFRPKVSNAARNEIREFLSRLNCPFTDLQVVNPTYEAIEVVCEAAFTHADSDFYLDRLRADVDRLLAPWVFEPGRALEFGGTLHRSTVVKFMEGLEYVDYVTDVALNMRDDLGTAIATELDEASASTAWSVLTSSQSHDIGTSLCVGS